MIQMRENGGFVLTSYSDLLVEIHGASALLNFSYLCNYGALYEWYIID